MQNTIIYNAETVINLAANSIENDNIIINSSGINGLISPISSTEIANKTYIDSTIDFAQTIHLSYINTQNNVTYTPSQILGYLIQRDPNGSTRYDSFPNITDLLTTLGPYNSNSITFTFIISNVAESTTNYSIILNTEGYNIIGSSSNLIIYPNSSIFCTCYISSGTIDIYFSNNLISDLSNKFLNTTKGPYYNSNIFSLQLLPNTNIIYNYDYNSNNIPPIQNCSFYILSDWNILTYGSSGINIISTLPTSDIITQMLGFTNKTLVAGMTWDFMIQLYAYQDILPNLYSFTITSPDDSITLDTNSAFTIEYSNLDWKYASYKCIATGNIWPTTSNIYTIYCTSYYNTYIPS